MMAEHITIHDAISVFDYATDRVDFNTFSTSADSCLPRINLDDLLEAVVESYNAHMKMASLIKIGLVK